MRHRLAHRLAYRIATWIACLAILMAALAPTVSHALAAKARGASWSDICTAGIGHDTGRDTGHNPGHDAGHDKNHSANDSSGNRPGNDMDMTDCGYCVPHAGSSGLPQTAVFFIPAITASFVHPALFYQSHAPLFIWSAAQSRAPPSPTASFA